MTRIAFLGLGAMGSRMAANLMEAGHSVTVWNRDRSKAEALATRGAAIAGTPKAAASCAEMVIAMVRDDEASRDIWLDPATGALAGMSPRTIAIECSTLTVAWVRALGAEAERRGIAFLDAPLAGSRPQAEARQLIFMVGGAASTLVVAEPVLKVMGSAVHHAGEIGAGAAVKLGVNALFGIQVAAVAEVLGMMQANGVSAAKAAEIIQATPVASPAAKGAFASMLSGAFAPMFPVELVEKDFGYVEAAGRAGRSDVPLASSTRAVLQRAVDAGLGADNLTGIARLYDGTASPRPRADGA